MAQVRVIDTVPSFMKKENNEEKKNDLVLIAEPIKIPIQCLKNKYMVTIQNAFR